jgi:hypothetical protein
MCEIENPDAFERFCHIFLRIEIPARAGKKKGGACYRPGQLIFCEVCFAD